MDWLFPMPSTLSFVILVLSTSNFQHLRSHIRYPFFFRFVCASYYQCNKIQEIMAFWYMYAVCSECAKCISGTCRILQVPNIFLQSFCHSKHQNVDELFEWNCQDENILFVIFLSSSLYVAFMLKERTKKKG